MSLYTLTTNVNVPKQIFVFYAYKYLVQSCLDISRTNQVLSDHQNLKVCTYLIITVFMMVSSFITIIVVAVPQLFAQSHNKLFGDYLDPTYRPQKTVENSLHLNNHVMKKTSVYAVLNALPTTVSGQRRVDVQSPTLMVSPIGLEAVTQPFLQACAVVPVSIPVPATSQQSRIGLPSFGAATPVSPLKQ